MPTKQIHLEVPAKHYRFLLKLLESLPFVRIQSAESAEVPAVTIAEQHIYDNVAQGFRELKLMQAGKLQARPIQDLLDELAD